MRGQDEEEGRWHVPEFKSFDTAQLATCPSSPPLQPPPLCLPHPPDDLVSSHPPPPESPLTPSTPLYISVMRSFCVGSAFLASPDTPVS